MKRISKQIAEMVANKQLAPKFLNIKNKKNAIREECAAIKLSELPKHIVESFIKDPKYFNISSSIILHNSLGHKTYLYGLANPVPGDGWVTSDNLFERYKTIQSEEKDLLELRETLIHTIYNLRTIKRVAEHFPELVPHFPEENLSKAELINFDKLRDLIKTSEDS